MDAGKRSACFSEHSESVGDSNFPDKSSDLSDGQTGMSGQGVRFTGMFPHAGMTKKTQLLADQKVCWSKRLFGYFVVF